MRFDVHKAVSSKSRRTYILDRIAVGFGLGVDYVDLYLIF
jgi:hypothetical protein